MDGRGRLVTQRVCQRLWRNLKQEEGHRRAYETMAEARKRIVPGYFKEECPHLGLDNRTPTTYSTMTKAA